MARLRITRRPDPAHLDGPVVYEVEHRESIFSFQTDVVIATQWCYVASFANIEDAEACVERIFEIEEVSGYVAKEYN
jgi:hypothetical protein